MHEEVKAREGNHVDSKLAEISIQLAREPETCGYARHGKRDKMVEVTIGRSSQLKCAEADVIKCFIVNAECLICVLDQLMHRQGGIIGFNYSVRDLWWRDDREGVHDPIRVLLPDL